MSDKEFKELFGRACKHCGDPESLHFSFRERSCFISDCNCPGFELDNLKYLEEKANDTTV